MPFSDEDVKRIKDHILCGHCRSHGALEVTLEELVGLFARLEAAEKVCDFVIREMKLTGPSDLFEAWRKSKGE